MRKILVIGEKCLDVFEYGSCTRLNPEAPTPVFVSESTTNSGGMAQNVFNNIRSIIGYSGDTLTLRSQNSGEIIKHRFVDKSSNYILLRVDKDGPVERFDVNDATNKKLILEADVVIVSDYNKGFLTESDLFKISNLAKVSFLDTKKPLDEWANTFTFIKINKKEFDNPAHNQKFISLYGDHLIVTLGEEGARVGNQLVASEAKVQVKDVSGAGDTFLAALAVDYLTSDDIIHAVKYANSCAALAVSQRGVVSVGNLL
jgi:bifunctional ADP-heptose synthase (sugar kinase/adenylyltransferase)